MTFNSYIYIIYFHSNLLNHLTPNLSVILIKSVMEVLELHAGSETCEHNVVAINE